MRVFLSRLMMALSKQKRPSLCPIWKLADPMEWCFTPVATVGGARHFVAPSQLPRTLHRSQFASTYPRGKARGVPLCQIHSLLPVHLSEIISL